GRIDDRLWPGTESVRLSRSSAAYYNLGPDTNVTVTLADNEAAPPALGLGLTLTWNGGYVLTVAGPATRVVDIETSSNLVTWQPLTTMINASGTNRLYENVGNSRLFFRARQVQ